MANKAEPDVTAGYAAWRTIRKRARMVFWPTLGLFLEQPFDQIMGGFLPITAWIEKTLTIEMVGYWTLIIRVPAFSNG